MRWRKRILTALYLLPVLLALAIVLGLCFRDFYLWKPFWRTYLPGTLLVVSAVYLCYGFFWLLTGLCTKFRFKGKSLLIPRFFSLLLLSVLVYAMVISTFNLRIDRMDMRKENPSRQVPEGFRGYRILQFSDLHIGSFTHPRQIRSMVERVLSLQPDMIVFTGDMVNFSTAEMEPFMKELARLQAPDGVYCILGNHDYGNYVEWPDKASKYANVVKLLNNYRRLGWVPLNNASVKILRGGDTLLLAGVENWGRGRRFPRRGKIDKALSADRLLYERSSRHPCADCADAGSRKPGNYTVLLSHDPTHFDSMVYLRYPKVDLTLSGHTHGMQVGLRIKGKDYSPARLFYEHYAGLYRMANGQCLYVNTGCGFNGLPFRLGMRPNMTLFIL